ncbi:dihydrolipoamide acetyltransferase component of pyruvate dehydrogenase complex [Streptomyces gelaticus]|uniref:Dihydrolipoamide acetyltransferase component of pyruvate dehydrogenase complex n=1 Tax=Streptomyces gelaticus TaxID=285446 RepID=A0ABQ2VV64_9ACTN|nr:dihydrolipoamide acetyltransferase family protein [Streptomyces gelaticus]GGV80550.1 dihydrolipoamide acetyltransferase component of pyruvate dehydrogenase complex [Streptomyces gelaticus]
MPQVLEFKLPDLGEGLTEAEIVRWLVEVGDVVAIDQPVVEVETAKAMVEVPCPYGGVVTARFGEEGSELPVGAPLLTVAVAVGSDDEGEGADSGSRPSAGAGSGSGADSGSGSRSSSGSGEVESSGNVLVGYGTGAPVARRRRVRPAAVTAAVPAPEPDPVPDTVPGPVAVVSPLVRKLARQHELDLRQLVGSGPDGLILRVDVEAAIRALAGETAAPRPHAAVPATEAVQEPVAESASGAGAGPAALRIPLRGVRGAVADKLARSRREIPDATCWVDADATELMAARSAMNGAGGTAAGPKVSVLALLARICTAALARFPELNSTVDLEAREIVRLPEVHLGFAAQTERGLVVPVVRDAQARNAESIGAEIARLTEAARAGRLTPAELTGGTFTLNNYGVFGVDGSTPIINHPEAAMLGVGRIVPKPWVHQGELAVRQVVQLSLTFDHRVCDGGTAGGFLRYIADCVEQPAVLLRTL